MPKIAAPQRPNKRLKAARLASGLKLREIAQILDVTPSAISQWEAGTANVNKERFAQLAEVYKCSVSDLIEDGDQVTGVASLTDLLMKLSPEELTEVADFAHERLALRGRRRSSRRT